jgi:acyl-CoA reductase-like NAD-dependent aldehyde dehydrogenase
MKLLLIFCPILPLVEYEDWPAALAYVNARPAAGH